MTPGISQPNTVAPVASGDWLAHTWRLVRWNLMLASRRLMGKILLGILVLGFFGLIGILLLVFAISGTAQQTASSLPPCPTTAPGATPSPSGPDNGQPCAVETQSQPGQSVNEAQQQIAQFLTFPDSLALTGGYLAFLGVILFCVLGGALVGNEHNYGTHRLALSRGASRAQLLAAQVIAFAILALVATLGILILGALVGVTLGPLLGGSIGSIPAAGWAEILGFWLVLALHLFAYTLIALLLATLARSTAAGIAGSLGYVMFESIALPIILGIALALNQGQPDAATNIQNVFLGPNLSGLLTGVSKSPLDLGGGSNSSSNLIPSIDPLQGLIVSLLYCAAFIGLSYWSTRKRDVTR